MAWSWSHTSEAYAAARENVFAMDREWLIVAYAEWKANDAGGFFHPDGQKVDLNAFCQRRYARALARAQGLSNEDLATQIWTYAERLQTCSNGGCDCYCCPSGCHTVYFSRSKFNCDVCDQPVEYQTKNHTQDAGLCQTCSTAFTQAVQVGTVVKVLRRQSDGTDLEYKVEKVEEIITGPCPKHRRGIWVDGVRYSPLDGYACDELPWNSYALRQRIVPIT